MTADVGSLSILEATEDEPESYSIEPLDFARSILDNPTRNDDYEQEVNKSSVEETNPETNVEEEGQQLDKTLMSNLKREDSHPSDEPSVIEQDNAIESGKETNAINNNLVPKEDKDSAHGVEEAEAIDSTNIDANEKDDMKPSSEVDSSLAKGDASIVSNNDCNVEASVSTTANESTASPEAEGKDSVLEDPSQSLVTSATPDEILTTTDEKPLDDNLQLETIENKTTHTKTIVVPTFCRIPPIQIIQGCIRSVLSVIRAELKRANSIKVTEEETKSLELLYSQFEELLQNMAVSNNKKFQNEVPFRFEGVPNVVEEKGEDENVAEHDAEHDDEPDSSDGSGDIDDSSDDKEISVEEDESGGNEDAGNHDDDDSGDHDDNDEISEDESEFEETSYNRKPSSFLHIFCKTVKRSDVVAPVVRSVLAALQKLVINDVFATGSEYDFEITVVNGIQMIAETLILQTSGDAIDPTARVEPSTLSNNIRSGTAIRSTSSFGGMYSSNHGSNRESKDSNVFSLTTPDAEQCILKLIETIWAVFDYATERGNILPADTVTALLNTCFHFVHRSAQTTPLLRSAAGTACSHMVIKIFQEMENNNDNSQYRLPVFKNVTELLQSTKSSPMMLSLLNLLNTALENTKDQVPSTAERQFLQKDLYKLLLSTAVEARDCSVLECTLRLFLNLWVGMRYELKCELEVFLQSVHFRVLDSPIKETSVTSRRRKNAQPPSVIGTAEAKEIVLDSMLDIYRLESNLLREIYFNYDCDVLCSNLYETMIAILGRAANPVVVLDKGMNSRVRSASTDSVSEIAPLSIGNRQTSQVSDISIVTEAPRLQRSNSGISVSSFDFVDEKSSSTPLSSLNRLALEGIMSALYSISYASDDGLSETPMSEANNLGEPNECLFEVNKNGEVFAVPEETLLSRKRRKLSLQKIATAFNDDPGSTDWLSLAVEEGVMPKSFPLSSFQAAKVAAELLYMSQDADKSKLGTYLSKGPEKRYPFEHMVRTEFVALYDFTGMSFPIALRAFLSKFRMSGEAQCIDRIMEVFSREYFDQQRGATFFKNSDAVYVLSFSTIMLNTDLHNRTIKGERMTKEQFVRNNRGINAGDDLDEQFLTELYDQIKDRQIQVRRETGDYNKNSEQDDFRSTWDILLLRKGEVENPMFTSDYDTKAKNKYIFDKDMFLIVANASVQALAGILARSKDDYMVVRTLRGLLHIVEVAASYKVDAIINDIVQILLVQGREYITMCLALDFSSLDDGASVGSGNAKPQTGIDPSEEKNAIDTDQPIPLDLLCCSTNPGAGSITGSAAHRGLLALDSGFVLFRKYGARINEAWPAFIECLCALRDARALPEGLSELDDFADSNGNVLPLSSFALVSKKAIDNYYRSLSEKDTGKSKGWFRSLFKAGKSSELDDGFGDVNYTPVTGDLSACAKALLRVAECADVEDAVQMGSMKLPETTIESLLATLVEYPFVNDPVAEQQSVFSLELAARALLSDRDHAISMFPEFLYAFESLFNKIPDDKVASPFVVERVVVAILRSSIHLYEVPEVRSNCRIFEWK